MGWRNQYDGQPIAHQPLRITHGAPGDPALPLEERQRLADRQRERLRALGYGGVVTNVPFHDDYLRNEMEWEVLRYSIRGFRDAGMRVWLYDEKGYPSGGAGGLTLKANPDFEAGALAGVFKTAAPGEEINIGLPRGHAGPVVWAAAYRGQTLDDIDIASARIDLLDAVDATGRLRWLNDAGTTRLVAYFARKRLFEGTHAVHNCCAARRYIDVSHPGAAREFIRNTYEAYADRLRDFLEAGDIEAMFTDEPSYMGLYMNAGLIPDRVDDPYDPDFPLLPMVNWGCQYAERFEERCGYDIRPKLPHLFGGCSPDARRTRRDHYQSTSAFYEEAFLLPIAEFCQQRNMPFSGHLLYEEDPTCHPPLEGDFIQLLRHMAIPGIDMLHARPETIMEWCWLAPKLASSAAHLNGRRRVMSEVSSHYESQAGQSVSSAQIMCSALLQYALGVNLFTSYFGDTAMPPEDFVRWSGAIGRVDAILGGGRHVAPVLLYYPYAEISEFVLPSGTPEAPDYAPDIGRCRDALFAIGGVFRTISRLLLLGQLDYDLAAGADLAGIRAAPNGTLKWGDESYELLVLPPGPVDDKLFARLRALTEAGVRLLAVSHPAVPGSEEGLSRLARLPGVAGLPSWDGVAQAARRLLRRPDILCLGQPADLIYLCRENQYGRSFLLVNFRAEPLSAEIEVAGIDASSYGLYDPWLDQWLAASLIGHGDCARLSLRLDGYQSALLIRKDME